MVPEWAKIPTFFMISGDFWIKKRVIIWLLRKGRGLERHSRNTQNAALNVDLF